MINHCFQKIMIMSELSESNKSNSVWKFQVICECEALLEIASFLILGHNKKK